MAIAFVGIRYFKYEFNYTKLFGIGGRVGSSCVDSSLFPSEVGIGIGSGGIVGTCVVGTIGTGFGSEPEELKAPSSPSITKSNITTATKMMAAHIIFFLLALRWWRSASDNCFRPFSTLSVACSTLWAMLLMSSPC